MGQILHNVSRLTSTRKKLRNNATKPEQIVWEHLRNKKLGIKFRRQYSVGRYILDFYSVEQKLCIEIDGEGHFSDDAKEYDDIRTEYLANLGIHVIRFTNREIIENLDGVLETIQTHILS